MIKCIEVTTKGNRCKYNVTSENGRCEFHSRKLCKGIKVNGEECKMRIPIKDIAEYCCTQHDPKYKTSVSTDTFRLHNLRDQMKTVVLEYRSNQDIYTGEQVTPLDLTPAFELDHVLELQCIRDCFHNVSLNVNTKTNEELINTMKDIVNRKENLGFTGKAMNKLKFEAVYSFCEEYKMNPNQVDNLVSYLNNQKSDRVNGWRKAVTLIEKEITTSYDYITDNLRIEDNLEEQMMTEMHDMFIVGMKLK